jgi:CDGSH-type Zn-finger protein
MMQGSKKMAKKKPTKNLKSSQKIQITENGPYLISGGLPLAKETIISDGEGTATEWLKGDRYTNQENYALCRCGKSKNKPYCDSTHVKICFDGTETAPRTNIYENAEKTTGPELLLIDAEHLCAAARFCHRAGGTWDLVEKPSDTVSKKIAIEEVCDCPSGRLVITDRKTGKTIEPRFEPSISLVEDPYKEVSGPIWVKGGVNLQSANGAQYETRNRVTLCRCGSSQNKPFCDSTHIHIGFRSDDKT